ncbi:MAG TPA: Spy/CpxP family protein refolding chaperone [Smithella sp.]|nr:Spy/CpxP family protein refolding chaperone [Smithella sp.]
MKKLILALLSMTMGLLLGRNYSILTGKLILDYILSVKRKTMDRISTMKKVTFVLTAVVMGVLLAVPAFAFGTGVGQEAGTGKDSGYHHDAIWKKLNLTDEQKAKIEAIRSAAEKDIRPLREKLFDKSVELRRLWLQTNPDKDKITAAQKEARKLRDQIGDIITVKRLEVRKVLTPEQNEKLANSHWGRGPGFGPRGGYRGQRAPCPGGDF